MGRKKGKLSKGVRPMPVPRPTGEDATPERIAMSPDSELVEVPLGSAMERQGRARRFSATHLDRLHRNGRLSLRQWTAGDWFRETHDRCRFGSPIVAAYGERIGGEPNPAGLPRTEAQYAARVAMRAARDAMPIAVRGFMERLLIHDAMPRYGGRAAMRTMEEIKGALDAIADYIRLPVDGGGKLKA